MTSPATVSPRNSAVPLMPVPRRIWAMMLRHFYLYKSSWPRLAELLYWPVVDILMFGFTSYYITRKLGNVTVEASAFFSGLLLYEIFVRTTMGILVMYMEEMWSRNLGHLFASPMRVRDYASSLICISLLRCTVAVIPAFIVTYLLFGFSILSLGWPLIAYALLLFMNAWWWALLVVSMILRYGLAAEWLGWMSLWLLAPFMAAYYPVSILPTSFQIISWSLPATYVFESVKHQNINGEWRVDYLLIALGLNLIYFALAGYVMNRSYRGAQKEGRLLQNGE